MFCLHFRFNFFFVFYQNYFADKIISMSFPIRWKNRWISKDTAGHAGIDAIGELNWSSDQLWLAAFVTLKSIWPTCCCKTELSKISSKAWAVPDATHFPVRNVKIFSFEIHLFFAFTQRRIPGHVTVNCRSRDKFSFVCDH